MGLFSTTPIAESSSQRHNARADLTALVEACAEQNMTLLLIVRDHGYNGSRARAL